jgi:hypothetical protein
MNNRHTMRRRRRHMPALELAIPEVLVSRRAVHFFRLDLFVYMSAGVMSLKYTTCESEGENGGGMTYR